MRKPQTKTSHLQLVPKTPPTDPSEAPRESRPAHFWALGAIAVLALGVGSAYASWRDAPGVGSELHDAFPAAVEPPLGLDVFVHANANPLTARHLADRDTTHLGDGYTFVLHNRTNGPIRFMLFGVDEHNTFFWFYPDSDAAKAHTSMPLGGSPMTTLPEGVTPQLSAGGFQIYGLFTDKMASVAQVEAAYSHGGADALRAELDAQVQEVRLTVE